MCVLNGNVKQCDFPRKNAETCSECQKNGQLFRDVNVIEKIECACGKTKQNVKQYT